MTSAGEGGGALRKRARWGGIAAVAAGTGLSDRTIRNGIRELDDPDALPATQQRRCGGGRKSREFEQPELVEALERLVESGTRGDPMSPLRWTCKSTRTLASELTRQGFMVSCNTVGRLLRACGYSLQANRKTIEGQQHPDRDAQFQHISRRASAFQRAGQPVISVDTKKKEPLGKMKNPGRTYRCKGDPEKVTTHDFPDKRRGKAVPYGVYDITHDEAGVSIGISHDTAEFAVAAIRRWWKRLGRTRYPQATRLLITADSGGSNSPRTRLWHWALQQLANETGMKIELCHYPPGTSKWNKIEHRLFCHITRNWQGVPLEALEIIVNLIGSTRTKQGLEVHAWLDETQYQKSKKVSDAQLSLAMGPNNGKGGLTLCAGPECRGKSSLGWTVCMQNLLFPQCLYGTASDTRKAWRRVLRKAWRSGEWGEALEGVESVPVDEYPGEIILEIMRGGERPAPDRAKQVHWWMNWIAFLRAKDFVLPKAEADRERDLIRAGLRCVWYAVGMVQPVPETFPITEGGPHYSEAADYRELLMEYLRWTVHWLPEFLYLEPRFALAEFSPNRMDRHFWFRGLLCQFENAGYDLGWSEGDWFERVDRDFGGDILRVLIERDAIEPAGDRYRLVEKHSS